MLKRFHMESDGGFYYIIDREASFCHESGYLGQRGRDVTYLDGSEVVDKFGWLTRSDSKRLARKLVKEWNVNPPWPPCPLSERVPTPNYNIMYSRCDLCGPRTKRGEDK